jgi:hypothetical protein
MSDRAMKGIMSIKTALAKLRSRNPNFETLRAALKHHDLPTSTGWDKLELKFAGQAVSAVVVAQASKLERIYLDNVEWGNKAIQILQFGDEMKSALKAVVAHSFSPEFIPETRAPEPVNEADLARLTLQPVLVRAVTNDTRTTATLYFYSRGYKTEKEQFAVEEMKDPVSRLRFAGFDQVIAYKQMIFQRIDTVYIDWRNCRVEFRADATRLTTVDRMVEALNELKVRFRALLLTQVDEAAWKSVKFPLVNFYPKIDAMYSGESGTLVKLAHNTPAGATNHGKMRGLKGDLKQDPSHIASMDASTTEKFAIQKAYPYFSGESIAYLSIPGKLADVGFEAPVMNTALIDGCIVAAQFDDLMQILR